MDMTDGNTKKSRKFFKKVKIGKRQALVGILLTAIVAGAIYFFSGWGYQAFYVQPREPRDHRRRVPCLELVEA